MPGEITSALRRIKSQNVNIIDDKAKVCAMLNDLEPSMGKERRRVRLLYETGAIHSVAKAVSNPEGARLYLSQAVSILTDQADMNAGAAAETVNYFTPLWNLPPVETGSGGAGTLDTDAIFEMMAKADGEKKAKAQNSQKNKNASKGRSPVYGQLVQSTRQQNPAFNQPLKRAGRLYGVQTGAQQNAPAPQPRPRRIYGSAAKNSGSSSRGSTQTASAGNNGAGTASAAPSVQSTAGMFSRRRHTPSWKNVAVKVRQNSGSAAAVSPLTAAQQAAEDLCRFYRPQLTADGTDVKAADRLCRRAVLLTAIAPAKAAKYFIDAAATGDVSHLSLIGRQILAWQNYLELEEAMGFACLQMAVDRGAESGAYALAHCYHTGTGILYCKELAEKYYHQAAARHPEITEHINRRLNQLHNGQMPTDTLWRYY